MAIERSLERLRTDYVDLWYWFVFWLYSRFRDGQRGELISVSHRLNGEVPVETVVSTMAEAVKYSIL